MIRSHLVECLVGNAELDKGWWTNSILFEDGTRLTFSCKYQQQLDFIAEKFEIPLADAVENTDLQVGRQIEFA